MHQIPLNNETMGFNQEVYFDILKQREAILKAEEENKKKREEYLKLTEPFRKKLENLRKEELEKLLSNKKFIKYCKNGIEDGTVTKDYHIQRFSGGCGIEDIDLIYEYGSKKYKKKVKEIIDKINKTK